VDLLASTFPPIPSPLFYSSRLCQKIHASSLDHHNRYPPSPQKKETHDFTIYLNPYWVINVEVLSFLEPYILSCLSYTFNSIVANHEVKYLSFTSTSMVPKSNSET
jgi:hypothetical protein